MWAAIATRVVTAVIVTQGWFFTNDDWDFVTRDGLGQAFEAHQGHLNVFNTVIAVGVRKMVGFDYWPGYGLVIAVAWPVVALAAWWLWRRRGVHPLIASGGAVLLTWLGSSAYMQFSQVNPAWAIAATLVALDFDQRDVSARNTGLGLVISFIAVFANTVGALAAGVRFVVASIRREWNGAITAGIAFAVFVVVRSLVTHVPETSFGFGDIPVFFRAVVQVLGLGLHSVIPYPNGYEGAAGSLLLVIAIGIVIVRRFDYLSTAAIMGAGAWLATAVVTKFLNLWDDDRLQSLLHGRLVNDPLLYMRFANVVMTFTLVAFIAGRPSLRLPGFISQRVRKYLPVVGTAALAGIVVFSIAQTLAKWEGTGVSNGVRAEIAGGRVTLLLADEPRLEGSQQRRAGVELGPYGLHRVLVLDSGDVFVERGLRVALQSDGLDWLLEHGLAASVIQSDIFAVRDLTPDTEWTRALLRFDFAEDGRYSGSWQDLGLSWRQCVPLSELGPMEVVRTTRFKLGWDAALPRPDPWWTFGAWRGRASLDLIVLRLDDDYGRSEIGVSMQRDALAEGAPLDENPLLAVEVLGPEAGTGTVTLTISGPSDAVLCHKGE